VQCCPLWSCYTQFRISVLMQTVYADARTHDVRSPQNHHLTVTRCIVPRCRNPKRNSTLPAKSGLFDPEHIHIPEMCTDRVAVTRKRSSCYLIANRYSATIYSRYTVALVKPPVCEHTEHYLLLLGHYNWLIGCGLQRHVVCNHIEHSPLCRLSAATQNSFFGG